jgi:hypothetical protein
MRRFIFWAGWVILAVLPVVYGVQIYMIQNLPRVEIWKWAVPAVAVLMIIFARNRDDVLAHHIS